MDRGDLVEPRGVDSADTSRCASGELGDHLGVEVGDTGTRLPDAMWRGTGTETETPLRRPTGIGFRAIEWPVTSLGGSTDRSLSHRCGSALSVQIPGAIRRPESQGPAE
jgi:hypothetical protein